MARSLFDICTYKKTMARSLFDICAYTEDLRAACDNQSTLKTQVDEDTFQYTFQDGSLLELGIFGTVRVDGRYMP